MLHRRHMKPAAKQDVAFAAPEPESRERELIAVLQDLVQELHPQRAKSMDVNESSRLERDLGGDSLARTELILRDERTFAVRLAGADASAAETVGDLLRALDQAHPARMAQAAEAPMAPLPLVPPAVEARTLIEVLEWHATAHPDRLHLAVLGDEVTPVETFTYRGLAEAAREEELLQTRKRTVSANSRSSSFDQPGWPRDS